MEGGGHRIGGCQKCIFCGCQKCMSINLTGCFFQKQIKETYQERNYFTFPKCSFLAIPISKQLPKFCKKAFSEKFTKFHMKILLPEVASTKVKQCHFTKKGLHQRHLS